jgi:hypothetical protein
MKSFVSTPTRRGDVSVESSPRIAGLANWVEPHLRGAIVGGEPSPPHEGHLKQPCQLDIKLTTPSLAGKCFVGGQKVPKVLRRRSRWARRVKDLTATPPKATSRRC